MSTIPSTERRAVPAAPPPLSAPADDRLIGAAEARRLAGGISDMTLWRWEQAGTIPTALRINRRKYWPRAQFLAALVRAAQ
jgi:predicted DNA-binding transcriptional regulator AlpA